MKGEEPGGDRLQFRLEQSGGWQHYGARRRVFGDEQASKGQGRQKVKEWLEAERLEKENVRGEV